MGKRRSRSVVFEKRVWRKGFATEAARECLRNGFLNFGFHEIIALTESDHRVTPRVLEKIGFTKKRVEIFYGEKTLVYSTKNNNQ